MIWGLGDWGLGIGDWGLGIGPNPQSPIPQPPTPNPQPPTPIFFIIKKNKNKKKINIYQKYLKNKHKYKIHTLKYFSKILIKLKKKKK